MVSRPGKKRSARAASPRKPPGDAHATPARKIHDLAWAGDHARAIQAATAALRARSLAAGNRIEVLDLRSESRLALGDLAGATADAAEMLAIARSSGRPALLARALCRHTLTHVRGPGPAASV